MLLRPSSLPLSMHSVFLNTSTHCLHEQRLIFFAQENPAERPRSTKEQLEALKLQMKDLEGKEKDPKTANDDLPSLRKQLEQKERLLKMQEWLDRWWEDQELGPLPTDFEFRLEETDDFQGNKVGNRTIQLTLMRGAKSARPLPDTVSLSPIPNLNGAFINTEEDDHPHYSVVKRDGKILLGFKEPGFKQALEDNSTITNWVADIEAHIKKEKEPTDGK